jgi:hypothetical protein
MNESTKRARVATIMKVQELNEAKATELADKLAGLTEEQFRDYAEYMAQRLAGIKAATGQGKVSTTTPRATDLPAPMAEPPKRVTMTEQERGRVYAAVKEFMADAFDLNDGEREDIPHSLPGVSEKVQADVVAYFEDADPDED